MEYIEIGKIVNTHGVKGEVKIYPYTNDVDNLLKLKKIYIDKIEIKVKSIKFHKNMFIASLENVDSMEKADALRNKTVYRELKENENDDLEQGTYYIKDIEGIDVYLECGEYFGKVKEVFNTGANDIYVIQTELHGDVLLPAIAQVVKDVDVKGKKMTIHLMEGLI